MEVLRGGTMHDNALAHRWGKWSEIGLAGILVVLWAIPAVFFDADPAFLLPFGTMLASVLAFFVVVTRWSRGEVSSTGAICGAVASLLFLINGAVGVTFPGAPATTIIQIGTVLLFLVVVALWRRAASRR
jgi:hypothetical protein